MLFTRYSRFSPYFGSRIVKTANTKTANNEGHLYMSNITLWAPIVEYLIKKKKRDLLVFFAGRRRLQRKSIDRRGELWLGNISELIHLYSHICCTSLTYLKRISNLSAPRFNLSLHFYASSVHFTVMLELWRCNNIKGWPRKMNCTLSLCFKMRFTIILARWIVTSASLITSSTSSRWNWKLTTGVFNTFLSHIHGINNFNIVDFFECPTKILFRILHHRTFLF